MSPQFLRRRTWRRTAHYPHPHDEHAHGLGGRHAIPSPGIDWRTQGVKVVPGDSLDPNTAQTPGMNHATAINRARAGAEKLWAGTVRIHPDAKTGAHHHGDLESVIFVVKGKARMRWGDHLEFTAEAGPGDFIYVPPYVPHQKSTHRPTKRWNACWCARARSRWW